MTELQKKRWMAVLAVVAWVAQAFYVLFPFDLLPDFVPVIGWLDDLAALVGLATTTVWMARTVMDVGVERLFRDDPPNVIDAAPYDPIPPDVLRAL